MSGDWSSWVAGAAGLLSVAAILYSWLTSRSRENSKAIAALDERLAAHEQTARASDRQILGDISQELKDVHIRIDAQTKTLHDNAGQIKQINQQMKLILEHLVSHKS